MFIDRLFFTHLGRHEWLLSEDLDLLPHLLLPLAGPEPFDDEDNEKLPIDLQYLPDNKQRESDATLRLVLIEALTQVSFFIDSIGFLNLYNFLHSFIIH